MYKDCSNNIGKEDTKLKILQYLQEELEIQQQGERVPYYFRYLGYREAPAATPAIARSNAIYSLLANTTPRIFPHELIAGNEKCLWSEVDETVLTYAMQIDKQYGNRNFMTNVDHYTPNYEHTVEVGITGLLKEIKASLEMHKADAEKVETLLAMQKTLQGFLRMIENHIEEAKALRDHEAYNPIWLEAMIVNCKALLTGAPKTFAQALQLVWFCHNAFIMEGRVAMALGRMDQYLYPFYLKDVAEGVLTRDSAVELLENVFIKLSVGGTQNICIGGMDMGGNCQVNELSYCVLDAVRNCNIPGPNLSARITPNTPDEFLDECLKSIGTGLGYPALMNDVINIEALKQYGYEEKDIYNYTMVGCVENFITGMQPPWTDGRFDIPKYMDYVFNNGISKYNKSVGLDLGDVEEIQSMQEFMSRFEAELEYGAQTYMAKMYAKNDGINQKYFPQPFLSCFCHDCIGRGLDIMDGGSKYPSVHGVALMGVGTTSDSLAAIEKVVFVDKEATLTDIKEAIQHNFVGYEDLHQKLLAAPKYGNNNDFVDKYAVWFTDYMSTLFAKYKTRDGGGIYIAMAANISNISAGEIIAATPDGRKEGEPLSDAASPTYGKDVHGATMTINSVTKPDYTKVACGTVVNQKFDPSMFSEGKRQKLLALIKTYFKKGGQEIQINATSRAVLEDAMERPENYKNLVVRVSGFSAYYVTLDKSVQLDILNRTQQA